MKTKKKSKVKMIIIGIAVFLFVEWIFIGYRFNYGPFKTLGNIRMGNLPGNNELYDMKHVESVRDTTLSDTTILFLGSSVTYGSASLQQGIPEYFEKRFGMNVIKEAVSGTTLVDNGKSSYISRMKANVSCNEKIDIVICQLSTNDASKELPLGKVSDSRVLSEFDTDTVAGAMEYIICYAKETWGAEVLFYTESYYENAAYGAMVETLYELQEKWEIGILDLWSDNDFNTLTEEERTLYMYDRIHPTKAGYQKWWCPELEKQLLEYMEK